MTTLPDVAGFGLIAWGIVIFLLLILLTVIFLVVYSGIFENITVGAGKSKFGSLNIAYKYVQGPYSTCGENFTEIMEKFIGHQCLGIFYDDPRKTPEDKTRYAVGVILSEGEEPVTEEMKKDVEEKGYKLFTIPAAEYCVFTSFRYTTQLSIYLAIKRVYPAIDHYIKEHRLCAHPMLEVYTKERIEYFAPLSRQDDYYIPEVNPAEVKRESESLESDSSNVSASDREGSIDSETVTETVTEETQESVPQESLTVTETVSVTATETTESVAETVAETTESVTETAESFTTVESTEAVTEIESTTSLTETNKIESESKSEGSVTPDLVLTPSDTGSEQSGSSFEDLAAEARQMGKEEFSPSEKDILEIQED